MEQHVDKFGVELQEASFDIYSNIYQLRDNEGNLVDLGVLDTFKRVAKKIASIEPKNQDYWYTRFLYILEEGFAIPAGRILSNAGAKQYKRNTSTINCLVSDNIKDNMVSILDILNDTGLSLRGGSGVGICYSLLRPKNAFVGGANTNSSGPISFAEIYDALCKTINSGVGRRGALMFTFHIFHPDIEDVIKVKREAGKLRQFNISILSTDEFMDAVKNDLDFDLYFPIKKSEKKLIPENQLKFKSWPIIDDDYIVKNDKVLCKIYKTVKAKYLYDLIMKSSYDFSDPGFINIDLVNKMNNLYFCEKIIASNPSTCGI